MLAFAFAPAGHTSREPTITERTMITRALPAWLRGYPVGCVSLGIAVSTNGSFAEVDPVFLVDPTVAHDPCIRYASNGYFVLEKHKRWVVLGSLSEVPPCSWKVPRDLAATCRR
jgi:hypothetical protein